MKTMRERLGELGSEEMRERGRENLPSITSIHGKMKGERL